MNEKRAEQRLRKLAEGRNIYSAPGTTAWQRVSPKTGCGRRYLGGSYPRGTHDFTLVSLFSPALADLPARAPIPSGKLQMLEQFNFDTFGVTITSLALNMVSCFQLADNGEGM